MAHRSPTPRARGRHGGRHARGSVRTVPTPRDGRTSRRAGRWAPAWRPPGLWWHAHGFWSWRGRRGRIHGPLQAPDGDVRAWLVALVLVLPDELRDVRDLGIEPGLVERLPALALPLIRPVDDRLRRVRVVARERDAMGHVGRPHAEDAPSDVAARHLQQRVPHALVRLLGIERAALRDPPLRVLELDDARLACASTLAQLVHGRVDRVAHFLLPVAEQQREAVVHRVDAVARVLPARVGLEVLAHALDVVGGEGAALAQRFTARELVADAA